MNIPEKILIKKIHTFESKLRIVHISNPYEILFIFWIKNERVIFQKKIGFGVKWLALEKS